MACTPQKAPGAHVGSGVPTNGTTTTTTTTSTTSTGTVESELCTTGATEACCSTGTRTCPTGEFPTWGPCLDANGQTLTCADTPDAGSTSVDAGGGGSLPPVDPACGAEPVCNAGLPSVFPAATPLIQPDVPADCKNGFELGDAQECSGGGVSFSIQAKAGGSRAITLDVDFATYLEPDGVLITGVDAQGQTYTLLDTCRIQTWTAADPTGGTSRPPDETIRQFRIDVKAGTTRLDVDFGGVVSPMYLQVLGLCDFTLPSSFSGSRWYQPVP